MCLHSLKKCWASSWYDVGWRRQEHSGKSQRNASVRSSWQKDEWRQGQAYLKGWNSAPTSCGCADYTSFTSLQSNTEMEMLIHSSHLMVSSHHISGRLFSKNSHTGSSWPPDSSLESWILHRCMCNVVDLRQFYFPADPLGSKNLKYCKIRWWMDDRETFDLLHFSSLDGWGGGVLIVGNNVGNDGVKYRGAGADDRRIFWFFTKTNCTSVSVKTYLLHHWCFLKWKKRYSKSVGASLKMHLIIKCSSFMCFPSRVPLLILGTHQRLHQYDLNVSMVSLDTDVHCVVKPVISLVGCFCPSDPEDNGHK